MVCTYLLAIDTDQTDWTSRLLSVLYNVPPAVLPSNMSYPHTTVRPTVVPSILLCSDVGRRWGREVDGFGVFMNNPHSGNITKKLPVKREKALENPHSERRIPIRKMFVC